jgi:hypothetical protein
MYRANASASTPVSTFAPANPPISARSSGVIASAGGNEMFCGASRSRTLSCPKLPP